jgi:hypothetical protein
MLHNSTVLGMHQRPAPPDSCANWPSCCCSIPNTPHLAVPLWPCAAHQGSSGPSAPAACVQLQQQQGTCLLQEQGMAVHCLCLTQSRAQKHMLNPSCLSTHHTTPWHSRSQAFQGRSVTSIAPASRHDCVNIHQAMSAAHGCTSGLYQGPCTRSMRAWQYWHACACLNAHMSCPKVTDAALVAGISRKKGTSINRTYPGSVLPSRAGLSHAAPSQQLVLLLLLPLLL